MIFSSLSLYEGKKKDFDIFQVQTFNNSGSMLLVLAKLANIILNDPHKHLNEFFKKGYITVKFSFIFKSILWLNISLNFFSFIQFLNLFNSLKH